MTTCPKCGMPTIVENSRAGKRLRECEHGHRFYTEEVFVRFTGSSTRGQDYRAAGKHRGRDKPMPPGKIDAAPLVGAWR